MWVKRDFLRTSITYDCRSLLQFIQDAEEMWEELGFSSAQDMIQNGYELDPVEVQYALDWLKVKAPDEAVSFERAVTGGRKLGKVGAPEGNTNASKNKVDNVNFVFPTKGGNRSDYLLARLERDRPDILEEFHQGVHKCGGHHQGAVKLRAGGESDW